MSIGYRRDLIRLFNGKILHNSEECRVVLRKHKISIGCKDISIDAINFILNEHKKKYSDNQDYYVLQEGE